MKKVILVLSVILICAVAFCGCGTKDNPKETETAPASQHVSESAEASAEASQKDSENTSENDSKAEGANTAEVTADAESAGNSQTEPLTNGAWAESETKASTEAEEEIPAENTEPWINFSDLE